MNSNIRITDDQVDVDGRVYKYDSAASGTPPPAGGTPPGPGTPPAGGTPPAPTPGTVQFLRSENYRVLQPQEPLHFLPGVNKWLTQGFGPGNSAEGHIMVPAGFSALQLSITEVPSGRPGSLKAIINGVPVDGSGGTIIYSMQVGQGPIDFTVTTDNNAEVQLQTNFQ